MTDDLPKTSWTCIVRAVDRSSPASADALSRLVELYRRPLLRLFRLKLAQRKDNDAEDWAHDFIVSHFLSGKIFENAKPVGRFRTYLAVAVRNYVYSRFTAEAGRKGQALKPLTFSALPGEEFDPACIADGRSLQDDEVVLAYERSMDCVEIATVRLEQAAAGDPQFLETTRRIRNREIDFKRGQPGLDLFKRFLREAVRAEVLVQSGESEQHSLGREIAILLEALASGAPRSDQRL